MKQLIYNSLPVWSQNLACSLYEYKEKNIGYGRLFDEKLKFLRDSRWFLSGEIEGRTEDYVMTPKAPKFSD